MNSNHSDQLKALNQLLEIIHYKGNKRKLKSIVSPKLFKKYAKGEVK